MKKLHNCNERCTVRHRTRKFYKFNFETIKNVLNRRIEAKTLSFICTRIQDKKWIRINVKYKIQTRAIFLFWNKSITLHFYCISKENSIALFSHPNRTKGFGSVWNLRSVVWHTQRNSHITTSNIIVTISNFLITTSNILVNASLVCNNIRLYCNYL